MPNRLTYEELEKRVQELEQEISKRQRGEEQLIHFHNLMDHIISHARSAIAVHDRDLNYIYVSKRYLEEYQVEGQDVIGKHHYEVFPDLPQKWRDVHQRSLTGEVLSAEEDPYYREDGSVDWTRWECRPWYESDGSVGGIIIYTEVINDRKKVEEALQESNMKYKELADSLPQIVFETDVTGKLTYANRNAFEIFGYTNEQFDKGLSALQMIIPEDRDRAKGNIQRILNGEVIGGVEYTSLKKDGSTFPVLIHSNVFPHYKRPMGLRGLIIDLSISKKMELDLKRLALAIEHSSDTVVITDPNGNIIYANPAFENITGYSFEEARGQNTRILKSGRHQDMFYHELWKTISKGKTWRGKFINKKKDGTHYTEEATISPIFSDTGEIINYVAVKRDISEKIILETQLRQAQKLESIGNLAGGIAHDFNNILSSIIGYTELSLDEVEKGTIVEDNLQEVYAAGTRARELVKQILAFARQSDEERKPVQVDLIVKEVLQFIRSSIPTTIEIKQSVESDSLVMANSTRIHQVLMNLCTNAAYALEEQGGILEVSLKDITIDRSTTRKLHDLKFGDYIELKVSDTGTGIRPEILNKIFEPYFTTKGLGEGTGMGLAMVHGAIDSYGGNIMVDSILGKGTVFTIYLPITRKRGAHRAYQPDELPSGTERILFVDDEAVIAKMGGQTLERLGYKVTIRTSSLEALELFRSRPKDFDLVLTDMTMPNMTGDKLATELMKIRLDIPVILCTGYSKRISDETASDLGIKAIAHKPINKAELAKTVRAVLDEDKS